MTWKKRSHSSSGISNTGWVANTPVLFTRMSTSGTCSITASAPSGVPTSAVTPRPPSRSAVAATLSGSLPFTTTSAPEAVSAAAVASSMPAVDPVTMAMRPLRSMFMSRSPLPAASVGGRRCRARGSSAGSLIDVPESLLGVLGEAPAVSRSGQVADLPGRLRRVAAAEPGEPVGVRVHDTSLVLPGHARIRGRAVRTGAAGGIGTSPWPCSLTLSSPPRQRRPVPPQKGRQR